MNTLAFLSIRVLHVLLAAIWLGIAFFVSFFLGPALGESGVAGGQVMAALGRRGTQKFIPSVAGLTVLSGLWLYWRFTGGFEPAVSRTPAGMAFGIGGVAGLIAAIVGGAVVSRGTKRMAELGGQVVSLPDGADRAATMRALDAVRRRVDVGAKVVLLFMVIALALMTVGHYI